MELSDDMTLQRFDRRPETDPTGIFLFAKVKSISVKMQIEVAWNMQIEVPWNIYICERETNSGDLMQVEIGCATLLSHAARLSTPLALLWQKNCRFICDR
jgi:hypothetical protein